MFIDVHCPLIFARYQETHQPRRHVSSKSETRTPCKTRLLRSIYSPLIKHGNRNIIYINTWFSIAMFDYGNGVILGSCLTRVKKKPQNASYCIYLKI